MLLAVVRSGCSENKWVPEYTVSSLRIVGELDPLGGRILDLSSEIWAVHLFEVPKARIRMTFGWVIFVETGPFTYAMAWV